MVNKVIIKIINTKTAAVPYAFCNETPSVARTYKCNGNGLPGSIMDIGVVTAEPTQNITAAASEIARVKPKIIPVMIPGNAAGKTTPVIVCHLVAPKPKLPSLYKLGTEDTVTSATWKIVGSAMNANIIPPQRTEYPKFNVITNNCKPNKPKIIDGMDANV